MSGLFRRRDQNELYELAYSKGVFLNNRQEAARNFEKAAKKATETGDQMTAMQAGANALLYRYLDTGNINLIPQLLELLKQLPQIEEIGSRTMQPTQPLFIELDCRRVEDDIAHSQNDIVRSRELHKDAIEKFKLLGSNALQTYEKYQPAPDGHNDRADMRQYYHTGMLNYWEAMTKKNVDPATASSDLSSAKKYFSLCNDQRWGQTVSMLLENWRITRTCWICHRDMQGNQLHFSLCNAIVTPYAEMILKQANQSNSSLSDDYPRKVAVCTPCGSMITFKAIDEAEKVRKELNAKLADAMKIIQALEGRVSRLERMPHSH